jgi:malate dehydrogenase
MTREDLLKGNCEIARQLGLDIKRYSPGLEFAVIIFNPADITGLTALVHSGLEPGRVSTLAALDSTRLQTRLSQHFGVEQDEVTGCRTYGGHGEKMAVFKGDLAVRGVRLADLLNGATVGGKGLSAEEWTEIQNFVRNGGARIIKLRGRSSYQSPSHQSVEMVKGFVNRGGYPWPCGVYFKEGEFANVMMAADAEFTPNGLNPIPPHGDEEDMAALRDSYQHLAKLRDEVIAAGILPPLAEWKTANANL